jgi:hypothetical protein
MTSEPANSAAGLAVDKTYHNVIILGAGASADAGIPLLRSFVDTMWEYATRGKVGETSIPDSDRKILTAAKEIWRELEPYNSRASFDNRNLEDILSLLSLEALAGGESAERYNAVVRAVARTIELSCTINYVEGTPKEPFQQGGVYHAFWTQLLNGTQAQNLPALITFNYDLVLERSLWRFFHHLDNPRSDVHVNSCGLRYCFGENDFSLKGVPHEYRLNRGGQLTRIENGRKANYVWNEATEADIPYFKLHGSLNWSQDNPQVRPPTHPTMAVEKPLILPPVFNKMSTGAVNILWKRALEALRTAKHIIIVGYSLPKTDIYMQYFLKAAVGPNSDLQKVIVFDPVLFKEGEQADQMRSRYQECFSPQFSNRIVFNPACHFLNRGTLKGSFTHFVEALQARPNKDLLFYP